jgi:HPt (histidine-containing phosphotransfer) domain-containing protein
MIDKTRLLEIFNQDEVLANKFLAIFKTQTPVQLAELNRALNQQDYAAVEILAHDLKTQCRYLGLDATAIQFEMIENSPESPENLELFIQLENGLRELF